MNTPEAWNDETEIPLCDDCMYPIEDGCLDPAMSGSCAQDALEAMKVLRRPQVAEWVAETVRRLTANGNMPEYLADSIAVDEALRRFR